MLTEYKIGEGDTPFDLEAGYVSSKDYKKGVVYLGSNVTYADSFYTRNKNSILPTYGYVYDTQTEYIEKMCETIISHEHIHLALLKFMSWDDECFDNLSHIDEPLIEANFCDKCNSFKIIVNRDRTHFECVSCGHTWIPKNESINLNIFGVLI